MTAEHPVTPDERHWTEESPESFWAKLSFDFEAAAEAPEQSQPRSLLRMICQARALGKKVGVVVYDDGDSLNRNGPINGQIFVECWKKCGCPKDFYDLTEVTR